MDKLAEARKVLASRAGEPKAKMFGLADDLRIIAGAFEELERRNGILAAALLHMHYWPGERMHRKTCQNLIEMTAETDVGAHYDDCKCMTCMVRTLYPKEG